MLIPEEALTVMPVNDLISSALSVTTSLFPEIASAVSTKGVVVPWNTSTSFPFAVLSLIASLNVIST